MIKVAMIILMIMMTKWPMPESKHSFSVDGFPNCYLPLFICPQITNMALWIVFSLIGFIWRAGHTISLFRWGTLPRHKHLLNTKYFRWPLFVIIVVVITNTLRSQCVFKDNILWKSWKFQKEAVFVTTSSKIVWRISFKAGDKHYNAMELSALEIFWPKSC